MRLNYPFKDNDLKKFLNANSHYGFNETASPEYSEKEIGGWYPIGNNDFWHAGVHLNGDRPVHAAADGEVVAYRVTDKYIKPVDLSVQFEEPKGINRKFLEHPISNNFVLTKHQFRPQEGKAFDFYMLFMHLLPIKELKEDQKKALSIFHSSVVTIKQFKNPDGKGLILFDEKGKEIAIIPKGAAVTLVGNGNPPKEVAWAIKANFSKVVLDFYGKSFTGYAKLGGNSTEVDKEYIITTDAANNNRRSGLNIREAAYYGAKVIDIAPIGATLNFESLEDVVDDTSNFKKPTDGQRYRKIKGYEFNGKKVSMKGYIYVSSKYMQAEKRYNPVVNKIENPSDLTIQKGDVLGWTGMDGSSEKKKTVHIELFLKDDSALKALRDYTKKQVEKRQPAATGKQEHHW